MPKLTQTIISQAKPRDKEYFIRDTEIPGFALRVHTSGLTMLTYQYRSGKKSHRINIGNGRVTKMTFAREIARESDRLFGLTE